MGMKKVDHPLCDRGFLQAGTGNFSRPMPSLGCLHWVGQTTNPTGWQARRYHYAGSSLHPADSEARWDSPIVADEWTAYTIGEVAAWGG